MKIKNKIIRLMRKFMYEAKSPVFIPLMNGEYLKDRNILVTGDSSGIGYAIAEACLRQGANVVITGRNKTNLDIALDSLKQKSEIYEKSIFSLVFDISDVDNIGDKLREAIDLIPNKKIDTLVNNAGVSVGEHIGNTDSEAYDLVMDTNLKGTYFISQAFSNYLINNNIKGNILNISSVSGVRPAISPYMVSKWGEIGLTKGLAKKLISYGIVVNGIAPGPTATRMLNVDSSDINYVNSPAGRYVTPEEVANLAVFLISDMGRMIVGETVFITGGCGTLTLDDIKY